MKLKKNKLDHARWSKWPSVPMIKKKKKKTTKHVAYASRPYLFIFLL
jgi:hypothetical protein